jgi:hypothetical protein
MPAGTTRKAPVYGVKTELFEINGKPINNVDVIVTEDFSAFIKSKRPGAAIPLTATVATEVKENVAYLFTRAIRRDFGHPPSRATIWDYGFSVIVS